MDGTYHRKLIRQGAVKHEFQPDDGGEPRPRPPGYLLHMTDPSPSRPLRARLEDYDGTHTDVLEAIVADFGAAPDGVPPEAWNEVVDLAGDPEGRIAAGATWLVRRWVEEGRRPTTGTLRHLADRLGDVTDKWARLHLVQALPSIPLPGELVPAWARFCRPGLAAKAPFLRAWSVNALVHLASLDPGLAPEARAALESALSDPKASVRARARKILEGR